MKVEVNEGIGGHGRRQYTRMPGRAKRELFSPAEKFAMLGKTPRDQMIYGAQTPRLGFFHIGKKRVVVKSDATNLPSRRDDGV